MGLTFPETRSSISGDAGDRMGRGGRKAIFFVDESAHLMRPALVDAAISMSTDCRIDMSSVERQCKPLCRQRRDATRAQSTVLTSSGTTTCERTKYGWSASATRLDPITFAQEVMNQFDASMEGIVIPYNYVNAAIDAHVKLGWKIIGMKLAGLDIADRGKDKNAIAMRHGILIKHAVMWTGKDSDLYEAAGAHVHAV